MFCFDRLNCPLAGGTSRMASSPAECCSYASGSFGVAFQMIGAEQCNRCPVGKL